ncbi:MAG: iron-containing alcohol dehydrogenase [Rhodothermales bacterium]|nr:iron-containing alcohol dehydrogenase [Rhodothermales bacterium]
MPFRLPTHVYLEPGCLERLPGIVAGLDGGPVLLVCDGGLKRTPWPARAVQLLASCGHEVMVFDGVEPNPRSETVDRLAAGARDRGVRCVVGLGGGSVLDAAKAVAMLLRNPGRCLDYEGKNRFSGGSAPFVAIPTTCGTGSEVTWVSVITDAAGKRKASVKGDGMFPRVALVDANLVATLPAELVAQTGMDALTHAVEAYTGLAANPVSDALAEKAVELLCAYLPRAVAAIQHDAEAREEVMRASTLAGMAFGNADVAGVHCLSESLGGQWDVPHGHANAVLLAPVLRYHLPWVETRLVRLEAIVTPDDTEPSSIAFIERVEGLVAELGIPPFRTLHIPSGAYTRIAEAAEANNSNASNPRMMVAADYMAILQSL